MIILPVMYAKYVKRCLDIVISLVLLVLLHPILLVLGVLIKIESKGPILFKQERVGYRMRRFDIYKFRTMTHEFREVSGEVFSDDPNVTNVGNLLRRFKLDELPQIINVLIGDMSLVGPRPLTPDVSEGYIRSLRTDTKPGMTGLAQVNGNIYLTRKQRIVFDECYVKKLSFCLDLKIVVKTVVVIVLGEYKLLRR